MRQNTSPSAAMLAHAAQRDHVEDTLDMVPASAEVLMTQDYRDAPVDLPDTDDNSSAGYTPQALRDYGDAREAAGYARGLEAAMCAASCAGRPVGAGDGQTRAVGSSAEAVQAIDRLLRAAQKGGE